VSINPPTSDPRRRVVIAGGSGMVGRHLAAALLADGWAVDVLSRDPRRAAERLPTGVRSFGWDPTVATRTTHPTTLADKLADAGAVINLSGASIGRWPWTPGRRRTILDSRLDSTTALVEAMGALPPDRRPAILVNVSGTDLYTGRDELPADESTEPATDFLAQVCRRWEEAAMTAEPLGVRVVIVRQAIVLARDAQIVRLMALPFRLFVGGRLGSGRQWFSWIHIDDLVGIYLLALAVPTLHGPINATAPEALHQGEFAKALGRALHRPSWLPAPAWAIRLALRGGQSVLLLGSRRVAPTRAVELGFQFRHPAVDEALATALR
jgi:uncharacterized protein